jgi:hypothetical protein
VGGPAPPPHLGGAGPRRSEAAWSQLADRAARSETLRQSEEQRKAEQPAAL